MMYENKNNKKSALRKSQAKKKLAGPIAVLKDSYQINDNELPSPQKFGELVRKYREKNGMSIDALAESIGMTRQSLSDIERGKRAAVNKEVLYFIVAALPKCSIPNLLGWTEQLDDKTDDKKDRTTITISSSKKEEKLIESLVELIEKHFEITKEDLALNIYNDKAEDKGDHTTMITFGPKREVELNEAFLKMVMKHPELTKKIVFLAKYADDITLDRVDELLSVGVRDVFDSQDFEQVTLD